MKRLATFLSVMLVAGCGVSADLDSVARPAMTNRVDDWRDEIIYQLMVDRFADGDARNDFRVNRTAAARYHGGDWQGVIDHLDYVESLGVTALWISPIVRNVDTDAGVDGYHGYWAQDFEKLNPHFGDLATLRRLVQECHRRDIKVIVDIVTNHVGQLFYYDINMNGQPDENVFGSGTRSPLTRTTEYDPDYDPRGIQSYTSLGESGRSPIVWLNMPAIFRVMPENPVFQNPDSYNRRGRITDYNIREQVLYGDFPGGLKDLRTESADVREALTSIFTRWVLETDIDGLRIDTLKHVEYEFWEFFCSEVRRRLAMAGKNNFFMFGEAFDGDDEFGGSFTAPGRLDSIFYFAHKFQVFDDVFRRGGPTSKIETLYNQRDAHYGRSAQPDGIGVPPRDALVAFLDNHDVPRFLYDVPGGNGPAALRAALGYLLTMDGIPCIYYGTEQEFAGGNDPANREDLWDTGYATDGETFRWVARLTRIRTAYEALRRGAYAIRWSTDRVADEQDAGIIAFERTTPDGKYALVVVNAQGRKASETAFGSSAMAVGQASGTTLVDVLTGDRLTVGSGSTLTVRVDPYQTRIFVPEDQLVAGL